MKGEYVEQQNKNQSRHHQQQQQQHSNNNNTNNMFSKLHHHHQQQQQHNLHPFANHFQQQQVASATTSDDSAAAHAPTLQPPSDGASIEVVRRPRGRPPGSKNKPKPPVIITRDTEPPMSPYILEVPAGTDVVDAIARFCRRKSIGLCVLAGSGAVSNVTLRQPSTTPGATVTFHGRFDILSVTATFLPNSATPSPLPTAFTISLAGPQGQIVGGLVAGALIAAGTVYVVAASFNNPSYHRLPQPDEDARDSADGGASPAGSGGPGDSGSRGAPSDMGMYGCHVAQPDVIWAPTARQPSQPPPPGY